MLLAAAIGPLLSPYSPDDPDFAATLSAPSAQHWLGTDDLGRDTLSRILAGARVSLLVGVCSVVAALVVGAPIGLVAGYAGGWTDGVLMRCMDVLLAFPGILLALGITAALGASLGNTVVAIAAVNLPVLARVARGQALALRTRDYVTAPLASSIITEAYLSFLGLGVQPPTPSWGNMLHDAIGFLDQAVWLAWFPGLAIFATVLGANLLGDALRDQLDPHD